jgi:hypothetical protein
MCSCAYGRQGKPPCSYCSLIKVTFQLYRSEADTSEDEKSDDKLLTTSPGTDA